MEQRELYYAGYELEKDLAMCRIFDELAKNPEVEILKHGRNRTVNECKLVGRAHVPTGKAHTGFEYFYIVFLYKDGVYSVNASSLYPFPDAGLDGPITATPYVVRGKHEIAQCGFPFLYTGIESVNKWLKSTTPRLFYKNGEVFTQTTEYEINIKKEEV